MGWFFLPERLKVAKDKIVQFWEKTTLKQRIVGFTLFIASIGIIALLVYNVTKTDFVQVYSNLSEREAGEVTAKLAERGIRYELTLDGRGVLVPKEVATQIKLDLAAEGIPKSGVLYNDFSQNMGLGLTDREFSVVERDAIQNELKRLIVHGINGINDAQVMITLPKESIWVNQVQEQATATVILQIQPGHTLNQSQINALYTIVSKSIPNLSVDDTIITNQYGEELVPDYDNSNGMLATDNFTKLNNIKKEVERDIERGLKQILGSVMNPENVVVKAFATMDFSQIIEQENLVSSPTDDNNGIVISMENLSESWNGTGSGAGGIAGVGETDVPGYQAGQAGGEQNYEKTSEKVNYEVNQITRSINHSPYRVADLSISVSVNMQAPDAADPVAVEQYETLKTDIKQVVMNVVRTTLGNQNVTLSDPEIEKRISVIATPFIQDTGSPIASTGLSLWWIVAAAGVALLAIIGLIFALRKRKEEVSMEEEFIATHLEDIPEIEVEDGDSVVRKQLERLAREKPNEFVSLLRTWIVDD